MNMATTGSQIENTPTSWDLVIRTWALAQIFQIALLGWRSGVGEESVFVFLVVSILFGVPAATPSLLVALYFMPKLLRSNQPLVRKWVILFLFPVACIVATAAVICLWLTGSIELPIDLYELYFFLEFLLPCIVGSFIAIAIQYRSFNQLFKHGTA